MGICMEQYVITISRQFGSMGRSIAKELSENLGIEFLDRDIVEATAKRMGLPVSVISDEEESMKSTFFRRQYPLGMGMSSLKDEIFYTQKNIIRDFAAKVSCIRLYFGRHSESFECVRLCTGGSATEKLRGEFAHGSPDSEKDDA